MMYMKDNFDYIRQTEMTVWCNKSVSDLLKDSVQFSQGITSVQTCNDTSLFSLSVFITHFGFYVDH